MQTLLQTNRLTLRRFTEADEEPLFELDSDPEVMRFLNGGTPTPRDMVQTLILPRFLRHDERFPSFGFWAAIERVTGDFLGWFSFVPSEAALGDVYLGFRLRTERPPRRSGSPLGARPRVPERGSTKTRPASPPGEPLGSRITGEGAATLRRICR